MDLPAFLIFSLGRSYCCHHCSCKSRYHWFQLRLSFRVSSCPPEHQKMWMHHISHVFLFDWCFGAVFLTCPFELRGVIFLSKHTGSCAWNNILGSLRGGWFMVESWTSRSRQLWCELISVPSWFVSSLPVSEEDRFLLWSSSHILSGLLEGVCRR